MRCCKQKVQSAEWASRAEFVADVGASRSWTSAPPAHLLIVFLEVVLCAVHNIALPTCRRKHVSWREQVEHI